MAPPSQARQTALITGATGFVGGYLTEALLGRGESVVGLGRRGAWPAEWAHLAGRAELRSCDLLAVDKVERLLRDARPARIYHLAGYAAVGTSFREPEAAWDGNLLATRRLYEAVVRWGGRPRILFVGSGLIYGACEPGQPPDENSPLRPTSPYATSKASADLVSYQYACSSGLEIVRARPCNHIGPRQSPQFAVASFARQVVAIERGQAPPVIETGNLAPQRDMTDVRDTVAAYVLLMDRGQAGEAYNIGTGQSYSMQTVLDRLLALTGLKVEVRQRPELVRPTDPAHIGVDAGKLRRATGWSPRYSLDDSLTDTLAYLRQQP
jgi:GDP-4-dehydro-6-deoxy-D-mannose reductase